MLHLTVQALMMPYCCCRLHAELLMPQVLLEFPSFLPAFLPPLLPFLPSILRWRSRAKVLQSISVWTLVLMFCNAFSLDLPYATPPKVTQIDEKTRQSGWIMSTKKGRRPWAKVLQDGPRSAISGESAPRS